MGRISDWQSNSKTISAGAAQTIAFTSSDIPASGVVMYHIILTGTGNTLAAIDRFRVKSNGLPFIDITSGLYRAFIQRFTGGRVHYPANQAQPPTPSAAGTVQDWRRFTIPLCFVDREKSEEADVCQFPVGSAPTVEIVMNTGAVAGTAFIGWTETDVTPLCWPKLYSQQANIAASAANARFPLVEDAVIRGFGVETTGLNRFRAVLNGTQIYHAQGQPANSTSFTEDMMFLETEQLAGGVTYSLATAVTAALDNSIVDPAWIKVTKGERATAGRSFCEFQTTGAWSGATSELGVYAIQPYEGKPDAGY